MIISGNILTVSDVNNFVKHTLESSENLKYLYVKGEVSNFKRQSNGHLYFSLKDETSMISAVMFVSYASKVIEYPKDGEEVIVLASISSYVPRGTYSLNVYEMELVGQGKQYIELEKLKRKLQAEGLFDASRKREINLYPHKIGVITASTGAAIKDIVTNIKRRYPLTDILVFPSSVQGENAPKELLKAFLSAQTYDLDTLIIGRGGGASEDLSAFNDETLVRAVANSKMPVISAVGHEIDMTLVDFVSDKRASTPTGAAELATKDITEIYQTLDDSLLRMQTAINFLLENYENKTSDLTSRLNKSLKGTLQNYEMLLKGKKERLEALNPTRVLSRGYSITYDKDGKVISNVNNINVGDILVTRLSNGEVTSTVKKVD